MTCPEPVSGAKGEKANGKYIPITGERKFEGLDANAGEW